jgi:hypothetical protein
MGRLRSTHGSHKNESKLYSRSLARIRDDLGDPTVDRIIIISGIL